jgi:Uma2 family endonuclease
MVDTAKRLATWDDLRALPEDARGEVISGVLVTPPAPLPRHSSVQRKLSRVIGGPFDDDDGSGGPGGWWILLEVDVRLSPHDIVRPDVAGWKRNRLPDPWDTQPIDVVPDWIAEVLSTDPSVDRVRKRRLYAKARVPHYWILDPVPVARSLEALELDENGLWVERGVFDVESTARIAPFDAIEVDVARLFPPR